MKGLRTDLVIFAVILSLAIHGVIMYYVRPLVMTHVVQGVRPAVKKGPMRVVRAAERPEPVRMESVEDVKPIKEAPKAEREISPVPVPNAAMSAGADRAPALPNLELPARSVGEMAPPELPEVRTADHSPTPVAEPRMMPSPDAPKPSAILSKLNGPADDALALPLVPIAVPALPAAPSPIAAEPMAALPIRKASSSPSLSLPIEVMEHLDEKVVEDEKAAVRDLIDGTDAKDLSKAVDVRLVRFFGSDGTYFRVTVSPKPVLPIIPKDVVVLIDASGSIGRERMGSIRGAAKQILRSASNTGDRFNLVAFRDRYSYAFRTWQDCTQDSFSAADRWINNVAPFGRTDVFATIASVLTLPREPTRPLIALVVTDGDANSGVSDTEEILSRFTRLNDGLISVYMYGVKASANRELIDVLTRGNRGESFIFEESSWFARARAGEGLEGLSERFREPVLSDLRLIFASDCMAEFYPRILRNLYRGGSVEILGRVAPNTREIAFSLKGLNKNDAYEAFFRLPLDPAASDPTLPRVWNANRAIDRRLRD